MKRTTSRSLLKHFQESDMEERIRNKGRTLSQKDGERTQQESGEESTDDVTEQLTCMTIYKRKGKRPYEELSWEKYGLHRQELRNRAAKLEKQLKARWSIDQLIDEQLSHFQAIYSAGPTTMKDLTQLLMPKEASAYELSAVSWFGDWRPTMILELTRSLMHSLESAAVEQVLTQLINDIRIEEAVIDEEMAEIQANCVLHLPFIPAIGNIKKPALPCIQSEFRKIQRVVTKAQNLRLKALELVVEKILSKTEAAEFLVAFARFQYSIHQFAIQCKSHRGPVSVPIKELGV